MLRLFFITILFWALCIFLINCTNQANQNNYYNTSQWVEKRDTTPTGSCIYWLYDNKKDSTMTVYDKNGFKTGILRFKNDLQHGITNYYYPSGKLKET
jgi:hypothetical protein